jgi:hypothetical protein
MSIDVQCPSCRTILRPASVLIERGGESPCPTCGIPLRVEPVPAGPRKRRRLPDYAPLGPAVPVWLWAVAGILLVSVLGAGTILGMWLLRTNGASPLGTPPVTYADLTKVRTGMSPGQVRAILGRPTEESDNAAGKAKFAAMFNDPNAVKMPSMRVMVWTDERTYTAVVGFMDDKVCATAWHNGPPNRDADAKSGWPGTSAEPPPG